MYPDTLYVASDGPAGTAWSSRMGVYLKNDRQQYNSWPGYQLDRGGEYLYYHDDGYWAIAPTVGERGYISRLQQGLLAPPATEWRYWKSGWKEDPQLTVSGETITMFGVCHQV